MLRVGLLAVHIDHGNVGRLHARVVVPQVFIAAIVHAIDFVVVAHCVSHGSVAAFSAREFVPLHICVVDNVLVRIVGVSRMTTIVLHITERLPVIFGS